MISYTSGTLLGSIATYACDLGYDLVGGDALRTCGSDGDWSGIEPTGCQRKYLKVCAHPQVAVVSSSTMSVSIKYTLVLSNSPKYILSSLGRPIIYINFDIFLQLETVVILVYLTMDKSVCQLEQLWDLLPPIHVILVMISLENQ